MSGLLGDLRNWLQIGLGALALTVAGSAQNIWVANGGSQTIATLNVGTAGATQSPSLGGAVGGVAVSTDGALSFASLTYGASVAIVNTATNALVGTVPVGSTPGHLATSPNGSWVYVVNQASNSISVISTSSKSVVATIPVGSRPNTVAFSPDSSKAYVSNLWGGTLSVINTATNTVTGTFTTATTPAGVAVAPDGQHIYVTSQSGASLTVLDATGATVATIPGFTYPVSVAVTPDGTKAYVVNMSATSVAVVNTATNTITGTIPVGSYPTWVAISADGTQAYVTNQYGYSVSVINTATNTVTKTINSGGFYPVQVAALPTIPGPTCSFQVSPTTPIAYPQSGGSTTLNVTATPSSCAWAVSGPSWLTVTPSATSGNGTVTISANANNTTTALSGSVTIAGQSVTVSEAGIVCTPTVTLTGGSLSFPVGGGTSQITVSAPSVCSWTATAPAWVTLTPSATAGNGTVGIAVGANAGTQGLNGTITVAGQSFAVTEAGIVCTYSASLTSGSLSFPATGGSATISVVTQSPCSWSVSGAPGVASVSQSAAQGPGTATVTAAANQTITALNGTVTVAGQSFAVTEAGITCTYTLSGTTNVPSGSGSGSITVSSPTGCVWSVTGNPAWTTLGSSVSSSGSGSISYSYAANNSTASRTGAFMIAGQEFDVTQAAFVFTGIRVHTGGAAVTDANSNVWAADSPHNSTTTLSPIANTVSQTLPLYQTQAYASGPGLTYTFTVPNGTFTVTLLFAETYFSASGQRTMDITINGQVVDPAFDIIGRAGAANTAYSAVYTGVAVSNGQLVVNVASANGGVATLAGIQIQ